VLQTVVQDAVLREKHPRPLPQLLCCMDMLFLTGKRFVDITVMALKCAMPGYMLSLAVGRWVAGPWLIELWETFPSLGSLLHDGV